MPYSSPLSSCTLNWYIDRPLNIKSKNLSSSLAKTKKSQSTKSKTYCKLTFPKPIFLRLCCLSLLRNPKLNRPIYKEQLCANWSWRQARGKKQTSSCSLRLRLLHSPKYIRKEQSRVRTGRNMRSVWLTYQPSPMSFRCYCSGLSQSMFRKFLLPGSINGISAASQCLMSNSTGSK